MLGGAAVTEEIVPGEMREREREREREGCDGIPCCRIQVLSRVLLAQPAETSNCEGFGATGNE